ncbi:hypothetical protein ACFQL4_19795 [Halosimplex aquaticum]
MFGIATTAAGDPDLRDGSDVLGALTGEAEPRERLFGAHETPRETSLFSSRTTSRAWSARATGSTSTR